MNKDEIVKYLPTIAYFDIFDYPLTRQEMEKWMINSELFLEGNLANPENCIGQQDGFYFLKGGEDLVSIRKRRYLIAEKKYRRALFFARLFRLLPSIKMIAVCNTLAFSNTREDSDIDFFIITDSGKIWLTRFWLQSFLAIIGARPHDHGISIKDALCLSFFITSDNLSLAGIRSEENDVYLALWISQLVPVYDPDNLYEKLWQENKWVKKVLPNVYPNKPAQRRVISKSKWSILFWVFTLPFWENFLAKVQSDLFHQRIKAMANKDRRVVVNDKMLKFHTNDRLQEYNNLWREKLKKLLLT